MEGNLSEYEQFKIAHISNRRASGTAIAGLVTGVAGVVVGVAGALWAGSRANSAREVAQARYDGLRDLVYVNANSLAAERQERIAGDVTLTQTVNDTVSGSQQSALTAQQAAELSAVNSVMQQTYSDFVTGRASLNPTPVSIYSAPQPCGCPNSCGMAA